MYRVIYTSTIHILTPSFSFGSGFNMENTDPDYIEMIAKQVALAKTYNIECGG